MDLFKRLEGILGDGCTLTINIAKQNGVIMASVLPGNTLVKDAAIKMIAPLVIKGTAEELDEGFVEAIVTPVETTNKMFADIEAFEEERKKAKEATEMEKKNKDMTKKNGELFSKWYALAEQNLKENKFKDAITCAIKSQKFSTSIAGATAKADALIAKAKEQGNAGLFGGTDDLSDGKNITIETKNVSTPAKEEDADDNADNEE